MNKLLGYCTGTVSMIFGSSVVFMSLIVMNELGKAPEHKPEARHASFEVKKLVQPPPEKKEVEKNPPREEVEQWRPPASLQGLDSRLAGVDVGLPMLEMDKMMRRPDDSLLGGNKDIVMTDDVVDTPPHPLRRASIAYPRRAKTKGIEGYVVLNLLITPSGEVERVKILESTPPDVFDQEAVESVRKWQFAPAKYKGEHVRVWAKQKIRFDLS